MHTKINIGGLVAIGFDPTNQYMITVSHSGLAIFEVKSWNRIYRDYSVIYPENGSITGIGPLAGIKINLTEKNYKSGRIIGKSNDLQYSYLYEDGIISITDETNIKEIKSAQQLDASETMT